MATAPLTRPNTSRLSFGQLEQLWIANGGAPAWAPTMAAVALAESSGLVGNLNNDPATGDYSVGLWQINYFQSLGPSRTAAYGPPSLLQSDPNANAKAAVNLLGNGSGITNWEGDAVGKAVLANGGAPLTASQAQSIAAGQGGGAVGGGSPSSTASLTSTPLSGTTAGSSTDCNLGSSVGAISHVFGGFTACQLKAVKGGALAFLGGLLMVAGVGLIIAKTGVGKKAVEATGAGLVIEKVAGSRRSAMQGSSVGSTRTASTAKSPRTNAQERDYQQARARGQAQAAKGPTVAGSDDDEGF